MRSADLFGEPATREQFIAFLKNLHQDFLTNPGEWKNRTLETFLEAMAAYAEDLQGYYDNTGQKANADVASWKVFYDLLMGAVVYE